MLLAVALLFSHDVNGQGTIRAVSTTTIGNTVKTTNGQQITLNNLVDQSSAMQILQGEINTLGSTQPANAQQEVSNQIMVEYYSAILKAIAGGSQVDEAIVNSTPAISAVNQRFRSTLRMREGDVLQTAVTILSL